MSRPFKNGIKKRQATAKTWWNRSKENLTYWAVLALATFCVYALVRPKASQDLGGYQTGQPSPRVLTAPFEFEYVDQITTQKRMDEAAAIVPPVYNHQPENLTQTLESVRALAEAARTTAVEDNQPVDSWAQAVLAAAGLALANETYAATADNGHPVTLYECLFHYRNDDAFWKKIEENVLSAAGAGIADDITPIRNSQQAANGEPARQNFSVGVILLNEGGNEILRPSSQEIFSVENFYQRFEHTLNTDFPDGKNGAVVRPFAKNIVEAALAGPTLVYNAEATGQRIEETRSRVRPVMVLVQQNDTIIGRNEIVTPEDMQKIEAFRERMEVSAPAEVGFLILALFFVFAVIRYQQSYYPVLNQETRKIGVLFLAIILVLGLAHVYAYLSLLDLGSNKFSNAGFGMPMGMLGVMITILVGMRLALFCTTLSSLYSGFILGGTVGGATPLHYVIVAALTSWGAIYTVSKIRQRSDLYRAGGVVIIMACVLILALSLHQYKAFDQFIQQTEQLKWSLIWGGVNGILVSILSISLLPIFEDLIGITTDIKLLELSQKNEILHRLEQEAPGTYQHSMRVATLAESAAEAIGANALLTRVGTYYHDIGKIEKPQYFVENQQTSADRAKHSKLSPNMSCLIIRNHVKYGVELAREYNIPQVIVNFIQEHHGTTLLAYFYHEALGNPDSEGKVKEEDFRYPGPKPQSKETAILMLADSLEATSRTLESATERDIRQLVRKIINERFMDGQFDECNLTLQDLHTLYNTFSESILHMMHQRISYPGPPVLKQKPAEPEQEHKERGYDSLKSDSAGKEREKGKEKDEEKEKPETGSPQKNGDAKPDEEEVPVAIKSN